MVYGGAASAIYTDPPPAGGNTVVTRFGFNIFDLNVGRCVVIEFNNNL